MSIAQPKTFAKRNEVAGACAATINVSIPLLVDDMEDTVSKAYRAWPDRLFILNPDATIAYRGERGPRGFKVDEMEEALKELIDGKP